MWQTLGLRNDGNARCKHLPMSKQIYTVTYILERSHSYIIVYSIVCFWENWKFPITFRLNANSTADTYANVM